jgi:hypothetical protein
MLTEKAPRTVSNAARWIRVNAPLLFTNRNRETLADRALRERLLREIGAGIPATRNGAPVVVVAEQKGEGDNAPYEIDFGEIGPKKRGKK